MRLGIALWRSYTKIFLPGANKKYKGNPALVLAKAAGSPTLPVLARTQRLAAAEFAKAAALAMPPGSILNRMRRVNSSNDEKKDYFRWRKIQA